MAKAWRFPPALGALLLLLACGFLQKVPFDSGRWKIEPGTLARSLMAQDLLQQNRLAAMTDTGVLELLGPAEWGDTGPGGTWYYSLSTAALMVDFDTAGRVARAWVDD